MASGQKTVADELRQARARDLQLAGFVHVTGLSACDGGQEKYIIQPNRRQLGHSDYNNGKAVIVTEDGEVWLGVSEALKRDYSHSGAFVPCSNGEVIPMHLLLERVFNPYSDCDGEYSPIPAIKD